jgi:hypothetical protein
MKYILPTKHAIRHVFGGLPIYRIKILFCGLPIYRNKILSLYEALGSWVVNIIIIRKEYIMFEYSAERRFLGFFEMLYMYL